MRARDSASVNLRREVADEASAAEQLESESNEAQPSAAPSRAPPATGIGSRSSFTEQPEPPNYSIEIEYVFKVYGPFAPQITPFFSELWQQQCQSEYATGRANVSSIRRQERSSRGHPFLNTNAHPTLRMGTIDGNSTSSSGVNNSEQQFITMVMPFFDRMTREAQETNQINARRDEMNELSNALRIFAPGPDGNHGVDIITYNGWRTRYVTLMNTPVVRLPAARERNDVATDAVGPRDTAPSAPPNSDGPRQQRQRVASPPRTVIPQHTMAMCLQELQTRFTIRQCGGDNQCCFLVLHVIEFTLGANRRQLYNCNDNDNHSHTRTRIVNWMRRNEDTAIIRLGDGYSTITVAETVAGERFANCENFESYCNWMAQPAASGGEAEIACFAAMYAADCLHAKLSCVTNICRYNIRITRHSVQHYLNSVSEEVLGLNNDENAPHHHVLHTPGHYAYLDPNMDELPASSSRQDCIATGDSYNDGLGSPSAASSAALLPSTST